ncbi:MAG TPA: rhodanese-like domain-containing protein [Polyangiaceae bacterium]|nr:rhodanese-like domain-containing protein [Polyangiaceae bacterium]
MGQGATRWVLAGGLVACALLALTACGGGSSQCYLVNGQQTKKLLGPGTILLDARPREPAPMTKLPGAIAVPRDEFSYRLKGLDARSKIVVFAESRSAARDAAEELREQGFVVYELGSVEDWNSTESKCEK